MVTLQIEKSHLYLLSAVFVFLVGIGVVISMPQWTAKPVSHSANEIKVKIGFNEYYSLQEVFNYPLIKTINSLDTGTFCSNDDNDYKEVSCGAEYIPIGCGISKVEKEASTAVDDVSCHYDFNSCFYYWDKQETCSSVIYSCTCIKEELVEEIQA